MSKYPTRQEVEECKITPTEQEIRITKRWKETRYNSKASEEKKIQEIIYLCQKLAPEHTEISYYRLLDSAKFLPKERMIVLNNSSIITALHEVGHAIYGPKELWACSWSTKLFKAAFPMAFKKLRWEGHMLKK